MQNLPLGPVTPMRHIAVFFYKTVINIDIVFIKAVLSLLSCANSCKVAGIVGAVQLVQKTIICCHGFVGPLPLLGRLLCNPGVYLLLCIA